jgi:hypothetical protein
VNPEIRRYLDEHGATYTPEALRKGLVDAGYDPAQVDAALAEWRAEPPGTRSGKRDRQTFGLWALGLHVGALVAMFALLILLRGTTAIGIAGLGAFVLGIALLLGGTLTWLIGRAILPSTGVAIALIVPAISAVVLGGSCFALLYGSIQPPPITGSARLQILPPRTFNGSGTAACWVTDGGGTVLVNAHSLGTLDGKMVGVNLSLYGIGNSTGPIPAPRNDVSVFLNPKSETGKPEGFGVIFSTILNVDVAPDALTGTIRFEGLASEPLEGPSQPTTPEYISGSVSWTCEG